MYSSIEKEIEKNVRIEDFPENFKRIAEIIGIDRALQLVKQSGGINQYIPVYDCVTTAARDRLILEEFNNENYQALAIKYRISEAWVRTIIDKDRRRRCKEALQKNQTKLYFEDAL